MLSIQKCRTLLGKEADSMTDEEVQKLSIAVNRFCTIFLDDYFKEELDTSDL